MTTQNDPLLKQAECLVEVAQINAIALYQSARNDFLFLQDINANHWESILTIAGVFVAANRLKNLLLNEQRKQILMKRIAERFVQWEPGYAIRGFEDCKSFFERAFDSLSGHHLRFVESDAVGSWIVLNILGRPANSEEEWKLVRTVGARVTQRFFHLVGREIEIDLFRPTARRQAGDNDFGKRGRRGPTRVCPIVSR